MKNFSVHYVRTENGKETKGSKPITCADTDQAAQMIEYDLEKTYPHAIIRIVDVVEA